MTREVVRASASLCVATRAIPLQQNPDMGAPPGPLGFGQAGDPFVVQHNLSAIGHVEAGEARQQRRLSASRRADERDELARFHRKAHPAKRASRPRARDRSDRDRLRRRQALNYRQRKLLAIMSHWSALSAPAGAEKFTATSLSSFQK
jgi:hypothetical protein